MKVRPLLCITKAVHANSGRGRRRKEAKRVRMCMVG
jgi:hypothetical protein